MTTAPICFIFFFPKFILALHFTRLPSPFLPTSYRFLRVLPGRRLLDLASGRSHSDEQEKLVFLRSDQEEQEQEKIYLSWQPTKAATAGTEEIKKEKESDKG
ncbi:hypothetical protein Cni_G23520 [Canna indica]|uniref:Uncharacterized protein n=1 Tax=Canna indica TaxID=4628 RepID=A0AAQ3KU16_9LILI|nr:hypothetical protein Cni_G23520 [Canna indica]